MTDTLFNRSQEPNEPVYPQADADVEVHLWDYVQTVLHRLPLAVSIFMSVMVLAVLYTWTRAPRFAATARLLVQPGQVNLTDLKDLYDTAVRPDRRDFIETQTRLVTSVPVMQAAFVKAGIATDPDFADEKDPVRALTKMISVVPVRNTQLIDISVERKSPHQAALVVNSIVDAFLQDSRKRRLGVSEEGLAELRQKAEELRTKLDSATRMLHAFMVTNSMVSFEKTENVIVERLRDLSRKLTETEPRRMAAQARVEAAEAALAAGESADALPDVQASPVVKQLKLDLSQLERDYSQKLDRLGSNHPQLQAVATQIDALRTKLAMEAAAILASLRTEYEQARREEAAIRDALREHESKVFHFNELGAEYAMLNQTATSIEGTYRTIARRIEEVDINRMGGQGENIFVIARAEPPAEKSWPRKGRNMIVSFAIACFLSLGVCFFLDYMDTTVKSETDVRVLLHSRVLCGLPDSESELVAGQTPDLVVRDKPRSHSAEAFRSLRTALAFGNAGEPLRTIVVSSTFPREGKSLVSVNIAIAQSQINKKTLLVDADMRKPRLHHVFSVPGKKGLSHLLAHDRELGLDDLVTPTGIENLFLLPCGVIPSNPVEVLDSARFGELVAEIRSKFDVAIFDSPPGFALVDPIVIGKRVDGLLMVIRSFVTPKAPTQQFAARLQEANVRLLGVVLNNADVPRRSYYYYYGSSYYSGYRYYAKYYEQEGDTTERKKRRAAAA